MHSGVYIYCMRNRHCIPTSFWPISPICDSLSGKTTTMLAQWTPLHNTTFNQVGHTRLSILTSFSSIRYNSHPVLFPWIPLPGIWWWTAHATSYLDKYLTSTARQVLKLRQYDRHLCFGDLSSLIIMISEWPLCSSVESFKVNVAFSSIPEIVISSETYAGDQKPNLLILPFLDRNWCSSRRDVMWMTKQRN